MEKLTHSTRVHTVFVALASSSLQHSNDVNITEAKHHWAVALKEIHTYNTYIDRYLVKGPFDHIEHNQ